MRLPSSLRVTGHSSLVFVYGTLRRGFSRHHFLEAERARFLSRGAVRGVLYDLGKFPGAVTSENAASRVSGEVYRLANPARTLKLLDHVEGIAPGAPELSLYRRAMARVTLQNGTEVAAWIYWLNRAHGAKRRISSGDYTKFLNG
ncbi:MAG: gamma-glutamylcyclotransferase [Acidobacteria bacterium]|nr:gamma-glutamylcyclotransferase [Acidobacteriota bacterium]